MVEGGQSLVVFIRKVLDVFSKFLLRDNGGKGVNINYGISAEGKLKL